MPPEEEEDQDGGGDCDRQPPPPGARWVPGRSRRCRERHLKPLLAIEKTGKMGVVLVVICTLRGKIGAHFSSQLSGLFSRVINYPCSEPPYDLL